MMDNNDNKKEGYLGPGVFRKSNGVEIHCDLNLFRGTEYFHIREYVMVNGEEVRKGGVSCAAHDIPELMKSIVEYLKVYKPDWEK